MPHKIGHPREATEEERKRRLEREAQGEVFSPSAIALPGGGGGPGAPSEVFRDEQGNIVGATRGGKGFFGFGSEQEAQEFLQSRAGVRKPFVEVAEARAQEDIVLAQQELQTTGAPVRRELDPTLEPGEDFPVVGPLLKKIRKTLGLSAESNSLIELITGKAKDKDFFELQPEELRTIALTEIEKNEIERGLTDSEKFGSFIEALGLGGLSNFAAEKPSENVQTILRQIKIAKTRATNAEIKVKDGTFRQSYGEEVINGIENDLQRFESRIKLLIQDSPELKFDSDGVNFIEDKIFEARERLFTARINILSGAATDPSEIQILTALQESIERESFEL